MASLLVVDNYGTMPWLDQLWSSYLALTTKQRLISGAKEKIVVRKRWSVRKLRIWHCIH
jgi:hypothetical protein